MFAPKIHSYILHRRYLISSAKNEKRSIKCPPPPPPTSNKVSPAWVDINVLHMKWICMLYTPLFFTHILHFGNLLSQYSFFRIFMGEMSIYYILIRNSFIIFVGLISAWGYFIIRNSTLIHTWLFLCLKFWFYAVYPPRCTLHSITLADMFVCTRSYIPISRMYEYHYAILLRTYDTNILNIYDALQPI